MGNKLIKNDDLRIGVSDYSFYCPGCKFHHGVWLEKEGYTGPTWTFNGNLEKPTFSTSLLVNWVYCEWDQITKMPIPETRKNMVCHTFITDGKIQFLSDCTHEFAGQTIDLIDE